MSDVNCPYCGAEQEINHDDGYGYEEEVIHRQECEDCGKYFGYKTTIIFLYEAEKVDCLNSGQHNYRQTRTIPKCMTKMRCIACGEEKPLTDNERTSMGIETVEEYLKRIGEKNIDNYL